uniref:Uncharacterized protein n=1 Tax=Cucumis melo TaxID=3656 RepID=A0A9I9ECW6_CUCME
MTYMPPLNMKRKQSYVVWKNEMPMNVGVNIDEDRTNNIFQDLLNEARNELYPGCSEFSSLNFLVKL